MDRVYEANASASPPAAPGNPSSGYPISGNPGTGTPATLPGPHWYYMMTEELRSVIAAAGITPDHTSVVQLLAALRSTGVFQTPAQFDNSTKAATTAFVQRALGSYATAITVSAATTLTAADIGSFIWLGGVGGFATTLPLLTAVPLGSSVEFVSTQAGNVVARQGADVIYINSGTVNSLTLNNGDSLRLTKTLSGWTATGGSAQLGYAAAFGASMGANGYQKLPSGMIKQWGVVSNIPYNQASGVSFNFPIVFPNEVFSFVSTGFFSSGVTSFANINPLSINTSGVNYQASSNLGTGTFGIRWEATGR